MSNRFYKLKPGQCTCLLGGPDSGGKPVNVRRAGASGAQLDPTPSLHDNETVSAWLRLDSGLSLSLKGVVVNSSSTGTFIQWTHANPQESEKIDKLLNEYSRQSKSAEYDAARGAPVQKPAAPKAESPPLAARIRAAAAGVMDVTASIRKRATKVRSKDLASRVEEVHVMGMGSLKSLIKDSVDEAVALHAATLGEEERKRILEEVEESVKVNFQAEKASLEEKAGLFEKQLKSAQALLQDERNKLLRATQFTVSDAGMMELEQRLGRILDRAVKTQEVGGGLETEMRSVVARLLDDERQKIRDQAQQAQSDKISLLEKKVKRLAGSLERAETERDHAQKRAHALETSGVVLMRNLLTPGLDQSDPDREKKLQLMKEIVNFNREVRQELKTAGRLAARVRLAKESVPKEKPGSPVHPEIPQAGVEPAAVEKPAPPGEPPPAPPAPQGVEEEGGEGAGALVPVTGGEVDPDELPWEPSADAPDPQAPVIKRPGR